MSCAISQPHAASDRHPPTAAVHGPARMAAIRLAGVRLHCVTEQQTIDHILGGLDSGRGGVVMTPNLDHMRRCVRDLSFSAMLDEAELVIADGMPLVWASRLQGTPLPQRVAGSDLITSLSGAAALRGRSVYLLGGLPGAAEAAAGVLKRLHPTLNVTGHHCPPVGFENDHAQMNLIISKLADAQPDIVFVALGSPKQERVIALLRLILPGAWWLGVGMSFSFLAGDMRRAPVWMRKSGLEWLHRLGQEPRRLFKRYIIFGVPFAGKLLAASAVRGVVNRLAGGTKTVEEEIALPARSAPATLPRVAPAPIRSVTSAELPPLSLRRLRAVVLLARSARPSRLTTAIGRNVLDLPIDNQSTILDQWLKHVDRAADRIGLDELPLRLLLSRNSPAPRGGTGRPIIDRDLSDWRGDGALLASLKDQYDEHDLILVADAAQVPTGDLADAAAGLSRAGGMVNLLGNPDGTPAGLTLMTCGALRLIPTGPSVDMNEQALPAICRTHEVRVHSTGRPCTTPVNTLAEYIAALGQLAGMTTGDPLEEEWQSSRSVIEAGAVVDPAARLHNSVVLTGGRVEAGAIVVRSVVCSGATVQKDRRAMDEIVVAKDSMG